MFVIQFAGNTNCVSDVLSNILKPIKNYQRSLAWGLPPALCMTIRGGVTDIIWLPEARLSMAL